jgi:glutamyl-tRNA reductase
VSPGSRLPHRAPEPLRDGQIVVLGGYGALGQVVTRTLAGWYAGRVVVAGRDARRAEALARATYGAALARDGIGFHQAPAASSYAGGPP